MAIDVSSALAAARGAVVLVQDLFGPWAVEIEHILTGGQYRVARVHELAMAPFLLRGATALFVGARGFGHGETSILLRCRAAMPSLRVVVVAIRGSLGDMKSALDSGATSFLSWPAPPAAVLEIVGAAGAPSRGETHATRES